MPTSNLTMETGKLMATVANLQGELTGIKKEIRALNAHVMSVHDELVSFIGSVQTKASCERLHQSLKADYVSPRQSRKNAKASDATCARVRPG